MKAGHLILAGVGVYVLYTVMQLKTAANTIQIVFSGVRVNGPLDYTLQFMVQNISNATIKYYGLTGVVSVNGTQVGNVSDLKETDIGSVSQQQININFQPSLLGLSAEIASLLSGQAGKTFDFNFTGNVNVDTLVLPVNEDVSITI